MIEKRLDTFKIIMVFLVLVISIILSYLSLQYLATDDRMTALEGKEIADEIASYWNNNATLTYIRYNNEYEQWMYRYWNGDDFYINSYEVYVYLNKTTETRYSTQYFVDRIIEDNFIDSDEAIKKGKLNNDFSTIESYNPELMFMSLNNDNLTYDNKYIWRISWKPEKGDVWLCSTTIDAYSGEILEFDINDIY